MRPNVVDRLDDELMLAPNVERGNQRRYRRADASREDPLADEVQARSVGLEAGFGHGDPLDDTDTSAALESPVDPLEVFGKELDANCLDHFDADDAVERALP